MPNLLLPKQIDNTFRGWRLGLWLFVPVLFVKFMIAGKSLIETRETASGADGIPLDKMGAMGASEAVDLFALLSWSQMLLVLLGVLALVRYRAMLPLIYLAFLLQQFGSKLINTLYPTVAGAATQVGGISVAFIVVNSLLAAMMIGFVLSLIPRGTEA